MAVLGPPGGVGEDGRPVEAPTGELTGEDARGEDCCHLISLELLKG